MHTAMERDKVDIDFIYRVIPKSTLNNAGFITHKKLFFWFMTG